MTLSVRDILPIRLYFRAAALYQNKLYAYLIVFSRSRVFVQNI